MSDRDESSLDLAPGDGTAINTIPTHAAKPLPDIQGLDDYLKSYGSILGKKAINALAPLHVPGRDELPDFDDMLRDPFEPQRHVIAAAVRMLDNVGSGFIVGEMGTGKTLLGMTAVLKHGQRSRNQGGYGGKFRCVVLCPDHLISKWAREIEETVPGAIVGRFGPPPRAAEPQAKGRGRRKKDEVDEVAGSRLTLRHTLDLLGKSAGNGRWRKPEGPEFYVLGRNQAKWLSDWIGLSDEKRTFGTLDSKKSVAAKTVLVEKTPRLDEQGRPIRDQRGEPMMKTDFGRRYICPRCGNICRDEKKGEILGDKDLSARAKGARQRRCPGRVMVEVADPTRKGQDGLDIRRPGERLANQAAGQPFKHGGKTWVIRECKEPLFHYTSRPYRWSPARVIQKKLRRLFQYLIIDEVHEHKSDASAQSMACGKLIGAVDHVLALTGTIIGGYADHLYPLMMRLTPRTLRDEGFEWGKDLEFSVKYGRIDRIVTTKEGDSGTSVSGNVKSMRRARSGNSTERKAVRPGVMPTMFGRHLIGSSAFITLEEMADELPDLFEYIGGPLPPPGPDDDVERYGRMKAGYFETAVAMEPAQAAEYKRVAAILEAANRELLRKGSMKLLGAMLWTTIDYPDRPWGWTHDPEVKKAFEAMMATVTESLGPEAAVQLRPPHTVGYWNKPGSRRAEDWVGVVTPQDCPESVVYPKERALIDICKRQKADGYQTWVFVQMTGKRNIQPRLAKLLEAEGLKVGVLRSTDVDPKEREDWIAAHGRDYDVMISHPQLVSTGLDLFSKAEGGHNFATIVFYETGYNLFTMRQAARRAWRIGQPKDCRIYYLYYRETMQHRAMQLMSRKMAAAQALEGEFSEDGLAAMAGEDNLQMALAKSIARTIDDADMQRSWTKVKGGPKKARRPTEGIEALACGANPAEPAR